LDNMSEDDDVSPSAGYIFLADYSSMDIRGGDGATIGGAGGSITVQTESAEELDVYLEPGSIIVESDILAQGGQGGSAPGGDGGDLTLQARGRAYAGHSGVEIRGDLNISGGDGTSGGNGGIIDAYGHDFMAIYGDITSRGGDALDAAGTGGKGAAGGTGVKLSTTLQLTNSGTIIVSGGDGTTGNAKGGNAGAVLLYGGDQTTNTGNIRSNGGSSSGTADKSDGGKIQIVSSRNPAQNNATLEVKAGTGSSGANGDNGSIMIDWVDVTPANGVL